MVRRQEKPAAPAVVETPCCQCGKPFTPTVPKQRVCRGVCTDLRRRAARTGIEAPSLWT